MLQNPMIELTPQQAQTLQNSAETPPRVLDPLTQQAYVLVRADEYERLTDYDSSPWTDEEMDLLAAEDADALGWEGMDAYQDEPEAS
jgi:hypothetical protein